MCYVCRDPTGSEVRSCCRCCRYLFCMFARTITLHRPRTDISYCKCHCNRFPDIPHDIGAEVAAYKDYAPLCHDKPTSMFVFATGSLTSRMMWMLRWRPTRSTHHYCYNQTNNSDFVVTGSLTSRMTWTLRWRPTRSTRSACSHSSQVGPSVTFLFEF